MTGNGLLGDTPGEGEHLLGFGHRQPNALGALRLGFFTNCSGIPTP